MRVHSYPVIAALPDVDHPQETIILVDRGNGYDRYVTGRVSTTDFTSDSISEWHAGHYITDRHDALRDLVNRSMRHSSAQPIRALGLLAELDK